MKKVFVLLFSLIFVLASVGCAAHEEPVDTGIGTSSEPGSSEEDSPKNSPGEDDGLQYYTVTFDSRGGSPVESQRVLNGNPVVRPEAPTLDGYFLNGWYTDEEAAARQWDFDTDRVEGDITLYAGWTAEESLEPTESLVYELNESGDGYTVIDVGEQTQIVIPAEYNGLPVTAIQGQYGTGAFARKDIVSVVIPDSIEIIGQNTFNNCSYLESVIISENSSLTEIGNNAFSGCSSLVSLYLPSGLATIGDSAFNNCGALEEFTVAEENTAYRSENGHLIESATNTLIRGAGNPVVPEGVTSIAPAAFRRSNGITELYIPASVESIGNYFIADSTISVVLYGGIEAEWDEIEMTDMWNYGNREVAVEYSAQPPQDTQEAYDILVVYFSNTGNTQSVAEYIAAATGGTLWRIEAADPYTEEDLDYYTGGRADTEQDDPDARSEIAGLIEAFDEYEAVFIGHPIWHGIAPRIIQTFLESYDFGDKAVYTFATSASSGGSGAFNALRGEYAQIAFNDNLHLTSSSLSGAQTLVEEWIAELGLSA